MIKVKEQTLIFSTGRRISVQRGVVGISPSMEVFHGHDGVLIPSEPFLDDNDALSDVERIELAEHMIALWQAFKERSLDPGGPEKKSFRSHVNDEF